VIDVPISYFFDDMLDSLSPSRGAPAPPRAGGFAEGQDGFGDNAMNQRETLELVRAFDRIRSPSVRKRVYELIKSMGLNEVQNALATT
jgi:hypothetical protein